MHRSLNPKIEIVLSVLCIAIIVMNHLDRNPPPSVFLVGVALLVGLVCGFLRGRAVRSSLDAFKIANSVHDVRIALRASLPGRLSEQLGWTATAIFGLWLVMHWSTTVAPTVMSIFGAFIGGRGLGWLPALLQLANAPNQNSVA